MVIGCPFCISEKKKGEEVMTTKPNGNQFREDEIVILTHWDKREEKWVKSIHPKIGGRLRLAHEDTHSICDE
jgi:hypothetical protein